MVTSTCPEARHDGARNTGRRPGSSVRGGLPTIVDAVGANRSRSARAPADLEGAELSMRNPQPVDRDVESRRVVSVRSPDLYRRSVPPRLQLDHDVPVCPQRELSCDLQRDDVAELDIRQVERLRQREAYLGNRLVPALRFAASRRASTSLRSNVMSTTISRWVSWSAWMVAVPTTESVRPTASLGAGSGPSRPRMRYPTKPPSPTTTQSPSRPSGRTLVLG